MCARSVDACMCGLENCVPIVPSITAFLPFSAVDCHYWYVEQPLPNPLCDPYEAGILILECSVVAPSNDSVSIGWFLDCDQLHNNSDISITSQVHAATMQKSRLTIMNMSDRYAGKYACNLLADEEFIPSDLFTLPTQPDLIATTGLTSCGVGFIQSRYQEKCAELSGKATIPIPQACTEPVTVSTSSRDITTTTINHSLSTSTPLSTSTLPLPNETKETSSRADAIWPYVMAAVAALLLLILILVAMLYMQKCIRQSCRITQNELRKYQFVCHVAAIWQHDII